MLHSMYLIDPAHVLSVSLHFAYPGNSVRLLGQKKEGGKKTGGASLLLPKVRRNPLIEIISINTGCLNQCSYCKTKHARGELGSYPMGEKKPDSLCVIVVTERE